MNRGFYVKFFCWWGLLLVSFLYLGYSLVAPLRTIHTVFAVAYFLLSWGALSGLFFGLVRSYNDLLFSFGEEQQSEKEVSGGE